MMINGPRETGWMDVYMDIPAVTRIYITASALLTLAANLELVSQYSLYLNIDVIVERWEIWRLLTAFLYAGPVNFGTVFNLLFTYRYLRILEEASFSRRTSEYCFMCLFLGFVILFASVFTNLIFLGHPFTHAMLYIWCRRNPMHRVAILGIMTFRANYIPLVLMGLSLLTGSPLAGDLVAILAGHLYYFLVDVFPMNKHGFRVLKTPKILQALLDEVQVEEILLDDDTNLDRDENNNVVGGGNEEPVAHGVFNDPALMPEE